MSDVEFVGIAGGGKHVLALLLLAAPGEDVRGGNERADVVARPRVLVTGRGWLQGADHRIAVPVAGSIHRIAIPVAGLAQPVTVLPHLAVKGAQIG